MSFRIFLPIFLPFSEERKKYNYQDLNCPGSEKSFLVHKRRPTNLLSFQVSLNVLHTSSITLN